MKAVGDRPEETTIPTVGCGGIKVVVELPLGRAAETFDLEKAVCSHGLFMMAPNYWHPLSKTLYRPLRLNPDDNDSTDGDSFLVCISHPSDSPHSLRLRVFGVDSLSSQHQLSLQAQVRRMLRLSEVEDMNVKKFQKIHKEAKESGFGRMFRSPTLFEDMVKCMLLCNCQWPRTLLMARALCELQRELKCSPSCTPFSKCTDGTNSRNATAKADFFVPNTPEGKEPKRTLGPRKCSTKLSVSFGKTKAQINADKDKIVDLVPISNSLQETEKLWPSTREDDIHDCCSSCETSTEIYGPNSCLFPDFHSSEGIEFFSENRIGNFPSPREIASLDEKFLAKRCGLGYRASRILNLAQSIVEGKIQLTQLEEGCIEPSLLNYSKLAEQLKEINGFGPYTCSNVLMCMGFYHVVPSDSETVRHLNQVHKIESTLKSVQRDVEVIYGNYAPFQFLAYWWEVWQFYDERFGKLSEMPHADYKLITASNMRPQQRDTRKRTKTGSNLKPQQEGIIKRTKKSS